MDENDLVCDATALAPLCKLRNVRTMSMEKNRLTKIPALIGTMLSLRHLLLYSNQLLELPASLCLITGLEVLDVHKNMINVLPSNIGKLTSLKKLDVSENKITELPASICELSEEVGLSVGRNPLEKPAIEQARQGIGVIRRFFGWSKKDAAGETVDPVAQAGGELMVAGGGSHKRPPHAKEEKQSRHDWAGPGGVILLFNCHCCQFQMAEGSDPASLMAEGDDCTAIASFNMQVIGRFRAGRSPGETFAERLEFDNQWLPWSSQTVKAGDTPTVVIEIKGRGRAATKVVATPWLAYGCSIGARLKTGSGFATVVKVREDDTCEVAYDGVHQEKEEGKKGLLVGQHELTIDPRPDTVTRTSSPSYKAGQVLMLIHEKRLVDAVVEHWFGPHYGSRHRVRLGPRGAAAERRARGKDGQKNLISLDLNEENHAKLLLTSVAKYETARFQLLDATAAEHTTISDAVVKQTVRAADQRLYLQTRKVIAPVEEKPAEKKPADSTAENSEGAGETVAPAAAPEEAAPAVEEPEEESINALTLVGEMIKPVIEGGTSLQPLFIHTRNPAEHDLLYAQSLVYLASALVSDGPKGERRQVPVALSMSKLTEMMLDENKRTNPRDMILKSFEGSYPKKVTNPTEAGDVLRQAFELRCLIVVVDVRNEQDIVALKSEAIIDELLINRLVIVGAEEIVGKAIGELPAALTERCKMLEIKTWGCFMNDARLANHEVKQLLMQMKPTQGGQTHYQRVSALHLSTAQIGKDTVQELVALLKSDACSLRMLDVSSTHIDGAALVQALASNSSLRSLDVRMVPKMAESYETMGNMLLAPNSKSNLAYIRCDAFEVLEMEAVLNLREKSLDTGTIKLLTGLLKNNRDLQELDLGATSMQRGWAITLMETLASNPRVATVHLPFNPAIEESGYEALARLIKDKSMKLTLML